MWNFSSSGNNLNKQSDFQKIETQENIIILQIIEMQDLVCTKYSWYKLICKYSDKQFYNFTFIF